MDILSLVRKVVRFALNLVPIVKPLIEAYNSIKTEPNLDKAEKELSTLDEKLAIIEQRKKDFNNVPTD